MCLSPSVSPSGIQASPNSNATLPCNVTIPPYVDKIDKSLIKAGWTKNGSDIASFTQAVTQIKEGFRWDTGDFINGDFSLTILRASLELQGLYECTITFVFFDFTKCSSSIPFLASPILSVPQQWVVLETESQLKCSADSFYPPPVSFSWIRDGQVIQPSYIVEGELTPDGYYMNVTFGCHVSHGGRHQELDFQLNITCETRKSNLPSVKLSAVSSKSDNIPLTLYCDVESFYPEEVSVSWLQNGTVLPEPPTTDQNPDGTLRTRRYYTLSAEQREQGGKVECAVNQPGVLHPVSGSSFLELLDPRGMVLDILRDFFCTGQYTRPHPFKYLICLQLFFLLYFGSL
uniref:Si:ch211-180a12.2 n=1 Tax=Labrus bergylta TaxID=56723 RepID=A0A3Q3GD09_9LABR